MPCCKYIIEILHTNWCIYWNEDDTYLILDTCTIYIVHVCIGVQSQTECRLHTVFIYSGWFIPTFALVLECFLSSYNIKKKKLYWSNEHIMYMLKLRHRTWISQVRNEPPIHVIGEKYDHGLCIYIEYLSNIWKFHRKNICRHVESWLHYFEFSHV